jgi:hypothetical protein
VLAAIAAYLCLALSRNQPLQVSAADIKFLLDCGQGDVDAGHIDVVEELGARCDDHNKHTETRAQGANVRASDVNLILGLGDTGWS